ncbi:MAG: serine hydrolase [Steroidobacteraceae bacterium]
MHWRMITASWPVAAGVVLLLAASPACPAPIRVPVRDDATVQAAVEDARARFLAGQRFDALDVTVLLAARDGSWLRGSVGGDRPWYPASCVKLGFAVAAVNWCESQGRAADCLDESVQPMLAVSDNVATGVVVDAITGAVNGPAEGVDFDAWFARRRYTENLLELHGLLDGQRFINKTYPTNSGEMPEGLEAMARERHGRNSMHADGSARLMLALVSGEFGAPAADYIRSRLRRPLVSKHSSMGGGFPKGTGYESKIGDAYDTLAEIVHAELPDGRRLIIAAYSNGRDPDGPDEQDLTALAEFARLLLERLPAPDD